MITRFAPTPSGFLHEGNAANALLVSWLAARHDGRVALRIDDADAARSRPEYVQDVFDVLTWLGVTWHTGPRDRDDFAAHWAAAQRLTRYRTVLADAVAAGLPAYACSCSRTTQRGPAVGGCAGGCAAADRAWVAGSTSLRLVVPPGTVIELEPGTAPVALADELGDFVIWRRDDLPAYQFASVVDDADLQVTDIVRGVDLRASSAAQRFLAAALDLPGFEQVRFWHHDLLPAADGTKLSKSQHGRGHRLDRSARSRAAVEAAATALGAPIGIRPPGRTASVGATG